MNNTDLFKKLNQSLALTLLCFTFALSSGVSAANGTQKTAKSEQVQTIPAKVNVNKASAKQLAAVLSGVGIKKAEAIVAWRKSNGKFKKLEDLSRVKGIGMETIKKNKGKLVL